MHRWRSIRHVWYSARLQMQERQATHPLLEQKIFLPPPRATPLLHTDPLELPWTPNVLHSRPPDPSLAPIIHSILHNPNWHLHLSTIDSSSFPEIIARLGLVHNSVQASFKFFTWAASIHQLGTPVFNSILTVLAKVPDAPFNDLLLEMNRRCVPDMGTLAVILCRCPEWGPAVNKTLEALVRRFGEDRNPERLLEVLNRCQGWIPSLDTLEFMVNCLVGKHLFQEAISLRTRFLQRARSAPEGFSTGVYRILILALCRSKSMDLAEQLFKEMMGAKITPDFHLSSALVRGHCRANRPADAITHYDRMIESGMEPGLLLHNLLIDCLGKQGYTDQAIQIFDRVSSRGFRPEVITFNSLIGVLCSADRDEEAMNLLQRMKSEQIPPDTITYSILIAKLGKLRRIDQACELYLEMIDSGCSPDVSIHGTMMSMLTRWAGSDQLLGFFKEMAHRGHPISVSDFTSIIFSFVASDRLWSAYHLFRGMQQFNGYIHQRVYNALVCGFARADDVTRAWIMFKEMKTSGFKPDLNTYRTMVAVLSRHARLVRAQEVLEEMKGEGLKPDVITYNKLLKMLGETGDLKAAFKLLREMEASGIRGDGYTYSSLLHNLGRKWKVRTASKLFEELESRGVEPCEMTFNAYIGVLAMADQLHEANRVYRRMKELRLQPDLVSYDELIRLNERFNEEAIVEELRRDMAWRKIRYMPRRMPGIKDPGYIDQSRNQQRICDERSRAYLQSTVSRT